MSAVSLFFFFKYLMQPEKICQAKTPCLAKWRLNLYGLEHIPAWICLNLWTARAAAAVLGWRGRLPRVTAAAAGGGTGSGHRWCSRRGNPEAHELTSFRETCPYVTHRGWEPARQSGALWGCWGGITWVYAAGAWCWLCSAHPPCQGGKSWVSECSVPLLPRAEKGGLCWGACRAGSITDRLSSGLSVFLCTAPGGELRIGDVSTINQVLGCLPPQPGTAHQSTEMLHTKDTLQLDINLRPWQLAQTSLKFLLLIW